MNVFGLRRAPASIKSSFLILATYLWGKLIVPRLVWEWGEINGPERGRGCIPSQTEAAGYGDPHWLRPGIQWA